MLAACLCRPVGCVEFIILKSFLEFLLGIFRGGEIIILFGVSHLGWKLRVWGGEGRPLYVQ